MKAAIRLGLAVAALAGFAVAPAKADLISIGFSTTSTPPGTATVSGTGGAGYLSTISGPVDGFSLTVSGTAEPAPNIFDSVNTTMSGNAGTLFIWVTDQNISSPTPSAFLATMTTNQVTSAVTSFTEQAWLDPGNGLFTTVDSLGGATFNSGNAATGALASNVTNILPGSDYSITEVYEVTFNGASSVSGNIDVAEAVPGPVVGAGLPGLLAACGGLIALARRRRRKVA